MRQNRYATIYHAAGNTHEDSNPQLTAMLATLALASACSSTRTQQSPAGHRRQRAHQQGEGGLIDDPITKAGQINVETFRGVVQLGGFVDTPQQKEQATKVARSVTGVREVRNDLRVSTPQRRLGKSSTTARSLPRSRRS